MTVDKKTTTTMSVLKAAQAAHAAKICVLPAQPDGSKRPIGQWKQYQSDRPSSAQLRKWFVDEEQDGLGFVCGKVSDNLELFEFDDDDAIVNFQRLAKEEGIWSLIDRIKSGYTENTPSGGQHWFYRSPTIERNLKLASRREGESLKVLIETRGEGGWAVVAPSGGKVHPTGEQYQLMAGSAKDIAYITEEERSALHRVARMLDQTKHIEREADDYRSGSSSDPNGTMPGQLFDAQASWPDVLEPLGWTFKFTSKDGVSYWTRPGKDDGISASTNYQGSDLLYVWSTSVPELEAEKGYSKWRVYALMRHDGKFNEAAKQLYSDGYRTEEVISSGPLVAATSRSAGVGEPPTNGGVAASSVSEPFDTLNRGGGILPLPPPHTVEDKYKFTSAFPPDHFIGRYIAYASQMTDAAHEYHEAAALVLMAACTNGVRLRLRMYEKRGISTNLFVLLVGDTTRARKSTAVSLSTALLDGLLEDAVIPDKFSDEGMIEQLAMRSGKTSLWLPDEMGQVLAQMDKKPALKDALLQVYDGKGYDYARHSKRVKGSSTAHEDHDRISDPHLSVLGLATPEVFDQISTGDVISGLIPRFALVYPQQLPPRMALSTSTIELDAEASELKSYLRNLSIWSALNREAGQIEVEVDEDALAVLDAVGQYFEEVTERQSVQARLPAMAIKLAMLSALGEQVPTVSRVVIEQRDAQRAAETVIRWGADAVRFASEIGGLDRQEKRAEQRAAKLLLFVREHGETTRSEALRHMRGVSADELEKITRTLTARGDLVEQERPTKGRTAKTWTPK